MDFARKQLEKYGWSDGKGLGKNENGISQPLKQKLKRSSAGIGYDHAADFTEHWWSCLYNKAAGNIEVQEKNGKTKKIKTKSDEKFEITNSTWRLNKKQNTNNVETGAEYSDNFVKTAVLTSGGSKIENVKGYQPEVEEDKKNVLKLTDEELFAACEGRTAHKGARHGLKALGKLARIEQQEQLLLQNIKYSGYSQAKKQKSKDQESTTLEEICLVDESGPHKKKKKIKHCNYFNGDDETEVENAPSQDLQNELLNNENDLNDDCNISCKKKKKRKRDTDIYFKLNNDRNGNPDLPDQNIVGGENSKIKKKKRKNIKVDANIQNDDVKNLKMHKTKNIKQKS